MPVVAPTVHFSTEVRSSAGGQQPELYSWGRDTGDSDFDYSPLTVPENFFTATAPAGYTSVPALTMIAYVLQKSRLSGSRLVGQSSLLGHKSWLQSTTLLSSIILFLIPWGVRAYLAANIVNSDGGKICLKLQPFHPACRYETTIPRHDPPPPPSLLILPAHLPPGAPSTGSSPCPSSSTATFSSCVPISS